MTRRTSKWVVRGTEHDRADKLGRGRRQRAGGAATTTVSWLNCISLFPASFVVAS